MLSPIVIFFFCLVLLWIVCVCIRAHVVAYYSSDSLVDEQPMRQIAGFDNNDNNSNIVSTLQNTTLRNIHRHSPNTTTVGGQERLDMNNPTAAESHDHNTTSPHNRSSRIILRQNDDDDRITPSLSNLTSTTTTTAKQQLLIRNRRIQRSFQTIVIQPSKLSSAATTTADTIMMSRFVPLDKRLQSSCSKMSVSKSSSSSPSGVEVRVPDGIVSNTLPIQRDDPNVEQSTTQVSNDIMNHQL